MPKSDRLGESIGDCVGFLLVVAVVFSFGFYLGASAGESRLQKQAIESGHAEWAPGKSGEPEFRWKELK